MLFLFRNSKFLGGAIFFEVPRISLSSVKMGSWAQKYGVDLSFVLFFFKNKFLPGTPVDK